MVEPEIGQHFLELPLAVDRAQQLLLGELDASPGCCAPACSGEGAWRLRRSEPLPLAASWRCAPRLDLRLLELVRISSALMRIVVRPASRASMAASAIRSGRSCWSM